MRTKRLSILPSMRDWYAAHSAPKQPPSKPPTKEKPVRTPATSVELYAISAIAPGNVSYVPATSTKRFARQIQGATELTDGQRKYLWQVVYRFRRQIANKSLVDVAKAKEGK